MGRSSYLFLLLLSLLSVGFTTPSMAEKRVALVIGNGAYRNAPALVNPRNDAHDIDTSLRELGFFTIVATDLDRAGMNDALDRFSRMIGGAEIALVYYSGHGMQFAGKNFLLPVEAQLTSAEDVNRFRLMPLDDVFDVLQGAPGARIVILDACRNNPVEDDLKRRLASIPGANRDAFLTRGFSRVAANGLIVAYSTQANDVAADGTGRNSPFAAALLHNMGTPDLDVRQMLFKVQDEVDRVTRGRQRPELSISLVGEYKLKPANAPANQEVVAGAAAFSATPAPAALPAPPNAPAAPPGGPHLAALTPSSATLAGGRFDGIWVATAVCDKKGDVLGWSNRMIGRVRNDVFHSELGIEGQPGSASFDGKIQPDGSIELIHSGISGGSPTDLGGAQGRGNRFSYPWVGQFDDSHGSAFRVEGRTCHMDLVKEAGRPSAALTAQPVGAGAAVAALSAQPDARRTSSAPPTGPELPGSNVRRFDGVWLATKTCPRGADGALGLTMQFVADVKGGVFHAQHGEVGKPDSQTYNGKIQANGTAFISMRGLSGASAFTPGGIPPGSPVSALVTATFQDSTGGGTQPAPGRICNLVFAKQGEAQAAPAVPMGAIAPPAADTGTRGSATATTRAPTRRR